MVAVKKFDQDKPKQNSKYTLCQPSLWLALWWLLITMKNLKSRNREFLFQYCNFPSIIRFKGIFKELKKRIAPLFRRAWNSLPCSNVFWKVMSQNPLGLRDITHVFSKSDNCSGHKGRLSGEKRGCKFHQGQSGSKNHHKKSDLWQQP